jgi:acylphosphatase
MQLRRVSVRIKGRVQGVFFRESARQEALRLGISGWVQNLPDGDVAAIAEGPHDAVEAFLGWCREGPPSARVADVLVQDETPAGDLPTFTVRR